MKRISAIILFLISIACPTPAADGEDLMRLVERGVERLKREDFDGAISDFTRAAELQPKNPGPYAGRGKAKHEKKDYAGALADYNRAIELEPTEGDWYFWRAGCKVNLNDSDGAIADATRAIELNPGSAGAYVVRGIVRKKRDPNGAIEDYLAARKLKADIVSNSELASAYLMRARTPISGTEEEQVKHVKQVVDDIKRAEELDPKVVEKHGGKVTVWKKTPEGHYTRQESHPEEAKMLERQEAKSKGEPDLRVVLLQPQDIEGWPKAKLRAATNWLYAHHGLVFKDKQMDAAYRKTDWYKPDPRLTVDMIEDHFNETEKANVKLLGEARDRAEK